MSNLKYLKTFFNKSLIIISVGFLSLSSSALAADTQVSTATYIGSLAGDSVNATEFLPSGNIAFGGIVNGSGAVFTTSADGQTILTNFTAGLGATVNDLDLNRTTGVISAAGSNGLFQIDGNNLMWSKNIGNVLRVGVSATDGKIAALAQNGGEICIYNPDGTAVSNCFETEVNTADLAIDGNLVYITGYKQVAVDLQQPYIYAMDFNGNIVYTAYNFDNNQAGDAGFNSEDTSGKRIAIGRDGGLYFLGRIDGGRNSFTQNPADITQIANNVSIDNYTNTSNAGGAKSFTYIAKFNKINLAHISGQFHVSRMGSGEANSLIGENITADETGNIYVAGTSAGVFFDRNNQTINGNPVGVYNGLEPIIFAVDNTMTNRLFMTTFTKTGTGTAKGISVSNGTTSVAIQNLSGEKMVINPNSNVISGGFYAVFGILQTQTSSILPINTPRTGGLSDYQENNILLISLFFSLISVISTLTIVKLRINKN
jgi:hypothetical protein